MVVVPGDVLLRPLAVVALMEGAEKHAGPLDRLDPGKHFELREVFGAEFENVIERAFGEDEAPVHVELAEIEGRIDQQFSLRRPIGEARPELRPRAVAECVPDTVRRLDFQVAGQHQLPKQRCKRLSHAVTPRSRCGRTRSVYLRLRLEIFGRTFQGRPRLSRAVYANRRTASWFGPIRQRITTPFSFRGFCDRRRANRLRISSSCTMFRRAGRRRPSASRTRS